MQIMFYANDISNCSSLKTFKEFLDFVESQEKEIDKNYNNNAKYQLEIISVDEKEEIKDCLVNIGNYAMRIVKEYNEETKSHLSEFTDEESEEGLQSEPFVADLPAPELKTTEPTEEPILVPKPETIPELIIQQLPEEQIPEEPIPEHEQTLELTPEPLTESLPQPEPASQIDLEENDDTIIDMGVLEQQESNISVEKQNTILKFLIHYTWIEENFHVRSNYKYLVFEPMHMTSKRYNIKSYREKTKHFLPKVALTYVVFNMLEKCTNLDESILLQYIIKMFKLNTKEELFSLFIDFEYSSSLEKCLQFYSNLYSHTFLERMEDQIFFNFGFLEQEKCKLENLFD